MPHTQIHVQTETGMYRASEGLSQYTASVSAGGVIESGGCFVSGEVAYGTSTGVKVSAGYISLFDDSGTELELSGNYETKRSNSLSRVNVFSQDYSWHIGYTKANARAMLKYDANNWGLKVGIEGGYRANQAPNIPSGVVQDDEQNSFKKEVGGYFTPRVDLKYKFNDHVSLNTELSTCDMQIGLRYTF